MSPDTSPPWFLVVAVLGLLWNLIGVGAFFAQLAMDPSGLPTAQRDWYESQPAWAVAGFAAAVFGGSIGCVGLLLRKTWALPALVVSLVGFLVQALHSFVFSNGLEVFGVSGVVQPALVFVIACLLIWLARTARERGWTG
ncbi:MAG: hypothetical protein R3190_01095 [Thermoanaerobaculia bacterium]|nr:hypothetical protein [Thermoanaerobaculia bacterium]